MNFNFLIQERKKIEMIHFGKNKFIIFLLLFIYFFILSDGETTKAYIDLPSNGNIEVWYILGPFAKKEDSVSKTNSLFNQDLLQVIDGESKINSEHLKPVLNSYQNETLRWKAVMTNSLGRLDLTKYLNAINYSIGYSCFAVDSKIDNLEAILSFGTDDGCRIWLNGCEIFSVDIGRFLKPDENRIRIFLKKGLNFILFKIQQRELGWGVQCRLVDRYFKALKGVSLVLIEDTEIEKEPNYTKFQSLNSIDPTITPHNIAQVVEMLTRVQNSLNWEKVKKRIPEEIFKIANAKLSEINQKFWMSQEPLKVESLEKFHLDLSRLLIQIYDSLIPLYKNEEVHRITVEKNSRYFKCDGKNFFPIGQNELITNPFLGCLLPGKNTYNPTQTDEYFRSLTDNGVNFIRIMLDHEFFAELNFEWPIGYFVPELVRAYDDILDLAEKHSIYVMICLWDGFWTGLHWENSSYNLLNGGPLLSYSDGKFFSDLRLRELQKNRIDFVIKRWGNKHNLLAIDIFNEFELHGGQYSENRIEWVEEMLKFAKEKEKEYWGQNRILLTVSTALPDPQQKLGEFIFHSPLLDFSTTHLYVQSYRNIKDPKQPAIEISKLLKKFYELDLSHPYFDSESGPIDVRFSVDIPLFEKAYHYVSWAHFCGGGAGQSICWPYTPQGILTPNMRRVQRSIAEFTKLIPQKFNPQMALQDISITPPEIAVVAVHDSDSFLIWLLNQKDAKTGQLEITLKSIQEKTKNFEVNFYNTQEGRIQDTLFIKPTTDGSLTFRITGLVDDMAVIVKPESIK